MDDGECWGSIAAEEQCAVAEGLVAGVEPQAAMEVLTSLADNGRSCSCL